MPRRPSTSGQHELSVSLYSFFGYCLLVIAAILAVRVLVQVFRLDPGEPAHPR